MPADDLAVEWMDYPTLARRLGTTHDAARQRAKRGRWARRRDNAGGWQVGVPVEALDDHKRDHDPPGDHDHGGDYDHEPAGGREGDYVGALNAIATTFTRHIDRLEQALAEIKEKASALERERDEARAEAAGKAVLAAQVEALNTALAVERERVEEAHQRADETRRHAEDLKVERDKWVAAAEAAQERIEQLTTKAAEADKRRGWWPWRRAS